MQSFLQYHRFRKQVERQHGHHKDQQVRKHQLSHQGSRQPPQLNHDLASRQSLPDPSEPQLQEEVELDTPDLEQGDSDKESTSDDSVTQHVAPDDTERRGGPHNEADHELKADSRQQNDLQPHLSRTATQKTQRSMGTALGLSLTGIDVRDRRTHEGGDGQVFVVGYQGPSDPLDPHNWGMAKRIFATLLIASIGFVVGFASSIDSSALRQAAEEFGVSEVAESLATGIYLIGFGAGALFAAPVSETLGRNPVYILTMTIYCIFVMASGLAPNFGAQLAFRFLAGFFGSTPLTCAGGSISDLWSPMERVFAFPVFANAAFMGPIIAPVIGGFVAQSHSVSWRWTEWTTLIWSGLVLVLVVLFQPETYPPILLKWKATHLRHVTGDARYVSEIEIRELSFWERLSVAMYRPFLLTFQEPVIILLALYLTVIYIVLFTFFDGYDYIFAEIHGTSQGVTGLCFLGIAAGLCLASALVPLIYSWAKRDLAKIQAQGGTRLPPEFRLWYCMLGGAVAIPVSLFWMGWTSYSWISIWSPLAASVLFGYGILTVFISSYQYIIDAYEIYAASALVSVTLIRYMVAGGMVVVGVPFYENMGVQYTLTILACISALLVPLPYLFYRYGKKIRSWSKYAQAKD